MVGNLLDPVTTFGSYYHLFTLELTRIILAVQVMACGVSLPRDYIVQEWRSLLVLLGPVMTAMWLITALGIYLIMGLPLLLSLAIAACLAPTDPVLANSIVQGVFAEKYIPSHVRLIISAESGANDGLGFPFLLLPILLGQNISAGEAIGTWIWRVLLYDILLSVLLGYVVGWAARVSLKFAEKNKLIDKEVNIQVFFFLFARSLFFCFPSLFNIDVVLHIPLILILTVTIFFSIQFHCLNPIKNQSFFSFSVALAIFIIGPMGLLGTDDILAAFIAGNSLTWDNWFNDQVANSNFQGKL